MRALFLALAAAAATTALGQAFSSGSDGSNGDLNVSANIEIPLPPSGVLNYKSVTINAGATVTFTRNALNTPVVLLAQGDVVLNGIIDVSGSNSRPDIPDGGLPGPGGFDGGKPGFGAVPPGDGFGPGGGKGGTTKNTDALSAGGGAYGSRPGGLLNDNDGQTYGNGLLIPLIGGSGGGGMVGTPGRGGGGGGGAILIASSTKIQIAQGGQINARGGGARNSDGNLFNPGSGGGIRLVAPVVSGNGELVVIGGNYDHAGDGRIRIDTQNRIGLALRLTPLSAATVGSTLLINPEPLPRLDIVSAAGKSIAVGEPQPVSVILPFNSSPNQTVKLQAKDFGNVIPIRLVLTPDNGPRTVIDTEIDNKTANPATLEVPVTLPLNVQVTIQAWTR